MRTTTVPGDAASHQVGASREAKIRACRGSEPESAAVSAGEDHQIPVAGTMGQSVEVIQGAVPKAIQRVGSVGSLGLAGCAAVALAQASARKERDNERTQSAVLVDLF